MSRVQLYFLAGGLMLTSFVLLLIAGSISNNIRSHIEDTYPEYSPGRYECDGTPKDAADAIEEHDEPVARASDQGSEYLRYNDDIVIVGPDGNRPCTVRVEDLDEGYSRGSFIYLGPGFYPGSPSGSSGGSSGGPSDGGK